jgi:hypothetical protein
MITSGPRLLKRSVVVIMVGYLLVLAESPSAGQPIPAGGSAAVLSFIDAAAGRVEVVRHWPWASSDLDVYPFIPYYWGACPGPGAIMMLVTGPGSGPPLVARIVQGLLKRPWVSTTPRPDHGIVEVVAALRTPGDPAWEALVAATPWVSDLATYERLGYAVFLFIHWQGIRCTVTLRAVPEGHGIPFVE